MPSCSVKWCPNHTSTCFLKNGVSFHRFPKDEATCKKWVEAVRFERRDPWWTSSNASRVCSIHFKESDISSTPCKVNILAKTAVPICTMVWFDDNENNVTLKPSIERINTILKTYERKKANIDTKLLETSAQSKTVNLREGLEHNSVTNISLKANINLTAAQKKSVLTELNKQIFVQSCTEKCCKSEILVKLNDNTSIILDEAQNNDTDTIFEKSNKVIIEPNTRICENFNKVNLKEFKSNKNKEPNQNSNSDMLIETMTNFNANISKTFVGKMLKTYLPKRKDKINEKKIRETSNFRNKTKDKLSVTTGKGLNTVKCKEVSKTNDNKYPKDDFSKKLNTSMFVKNNIMADLLLNKSSQELNKFCALKNVKKYYFKRKSKLFDESKIKVKNEGILNAHTESNKTLFHEYITNQPRTDNIKETDTVYNEIISELFETSKNEYVSNTPSIGKYQETNKNMNTALDKGKNYMNVISNLNTNVNTELNTLMDLEVCNVVNSGLNDEINTEVNTDKMAIHGSFAQFNEKTVTESNQPLSILNRNMNPDSHHNLNAEIHQNILTQSNKDIYYNEYTNNALVLTNNESNNLDTLFVRNIDRNTTKKAEFTELKKCLSRSKLDFSTELCINIVKDIATNLSSKYDNNMSTAIIEENIQVPDQDHNAEFDKNIGIAVNDLVHGISLQDINADAIEESDSNVKCSKQLNTILIQKFIAKKSPESNNTEKMDFISNFNTIPNTTTPEFDKLNISNINIKCNKTLVKDMPDLSLGSCVMNIGCNDEINIEFNTEKTDNTDFTQHNEKTVTKSNQQLPIFNKDILMEQSDYTPMEINGNIKTQGNKNAYYNENITNNATILSNNESQNLEPSVVDDKFSELKKHLSMKHQERNAEFDKKSNIDVNNTVTSIQNNINNVTNREIESNVSSSKQRFSNLDEELMKNISPGSNSNKNVHGIDNLKIDQTTVTTLNKNINSVNKEYKKCIKKEMPGLNTVILLELNKDQVINLKEEFHHLNTEILNDKDLLLRKSDKDFENVLTTSDNQQTVVNEHMDVVNSILNRDLAAEFDLSLLLSDTPIPDEEIQNVDNNSNYNSLDGIGGSPNWIHLPTGEMPKIIDDLLDQDSFFENLDLFDKVNKFNMDKADNKKDNEIKKSVKEKYSTSNVEQFEKQIINNLCETGKQCTKNSMSDIEKQLIAEFSVFNETRLGQSNNICNENKVSQSKKVIAKKCYDLCGEQTDKEIIKQCGENKQNQIVDECSEQNKEIQIGNKTISECQNQTNNVESKPNQIGDPEDLFFIPYFEQREKLHKEQFGQAIDNSNEQVLSVVDSFDQSKKQYDKQTNEQTYPTSVGKLIAMEESTPKSKIHNQDILGKKKEINKLSKDLNEKRIEENHYLSHKTHSVDMESEPEPNIGKLKRVIFEECYDSECQNNCKHRKHNANTESHKKEVQRYVNETNYTPYDLLYKQQCDQSSIDNFSKQLSDGSSDQYIKQMREKDFLERHKLSHNVKYKTKCKKIAIDHIPGQYLELRWKESLGKSNTIDQEGYKRKYKDLGLKERLQRKILCSETTKFSQQIMAECPECGYTTDDNDLINYQNDVDLRITKPLSLINKDMLISFNETEINNKNNNRVAIDSVFAIELAYVTAIQALERKLKQKVAISDYRLRRVNELSKINNKLIQANINRLFS